ncbi:hypothetical protein ID866_12344, partial [Astraeus odoratus]
MNTAKACLVGTRGEILTEIVNWIGSTNVDVPRVFWLSGLAGQGKSAIAHTVAAWFRDLGGLCACFCFARDRKADRLHEKIFITIARDLADCDPSLKRAFVEVISKNRSLKSTPDIMQQWQRLIVEP